MDTKKLASDNPPNPLGGDPPNPSSLVEPSPAPTTYYAITVGKECGVYHDVCKLDLAKVAAEGRFAMSVFTRWIDAAAYYRKEFERGNVFTTRSGDTKNSPITVPPDAPTPPFTKNPTAASGLARRKDSFSRMGTPTPQPGSTRSKAPRPASSKPPRPQPTGAMTRVKKAPRGPSGERLILLKDVIDISDEDISDLEGYIVPLKKKPAASSSASTSGPTNSLVQALAALPTALSSIPPAAVAHPQIRAPAPFPMSIPSVPAATTEAPTPPPALLPIVAMPNPNPVTPVKRRYVKIYLAQGEDFDEPAFMERILQSACRTPTVQATASARQATPGPSTASTRRQATPGPSTASTRQPTPGSSRLEEQNLTSNHESGRDPSPAPLLDSFNDATSANTSLEDSPSALSSASRDTEQELGYGLMDPSVLAQLDF